MFSFANNKNLYFHHVPQEMFIFKLVQVRLEVENQKTKGTTFALLFLTHFPMTCYEILLTAPSMCLHKKKIMVYLSYLNKCTKCKGERVKWNERLGQLSRISGHIKSAAKRHKCRDDVIVTSAWQLLSIIRRHAWLFFSPLFPFLLHPSPTRILI